MMQKEEKPSLPGVTSLVGIRILFFNAKAGDLGTVIGSTFFSGTPCKEEAIQLDIPEQSLLGCMRRLNPSLTGEFTDQESNNG